MKLVCAASLLLLGTIGNVHAGKVSTEYKRSETRRLMWVDGNAQPDLPSCFRVLFVVVVELFHTSCNLHCYHGLRRVIECAGCCGVVLVDRRDDDLLLGLFPRLVYKKSMLHAQC